MKLCGAEYAEETVVSEAFVDIFRNIRYNEPV